MQLTPNYKLKKPEGADPVDIQDFNDNADLIDAALKKKAESSGGDISGMTVKTLDDITTEFPVPVAGESTKTFLGKVKKFFSDTKNWMTGVCLIGQIVNNCVTNNAKLPLSAAQGKVLMDLYNVLNTNLADAIIKSTYKTALRSPDKTHTLGIHDNGTAYMDDTKVITNADLIHGNTDAFSVPANSERRITVDLSRYNVGTNYRLYAVVRGSTWANVGAIYCNNNQTIIDTRNLNSTAVNISLWYTVIRK